VNGRSSLLYWQGFGELRFHEAFNDLRQAPWALLSGYPTQTLTDVLGHHLDSAGHEATTLPGGVPGEKLTLTIKSSALPQTIRYLGGSPADLRAIASVRGSPISMTFVLNEAGALVDWTLAIAFDVEGVDLTGTAGSPDGALLEGHFEQKVSAHLERAASPIAIAVPEADEMGQLPAYTGPERGALYASLDTFDEALNRAITGGTLDEFWQELAAARTMPLVFDDLAVFVFRGAAHSVTWESDWQYQRATATDRLDDTDVWMHTVRLPLDARLEYGLQVDGLAAELDLLNPNVETGGLGSKSVVEMPGYAAPAYAVPRAGVAAGTLTEAVPLASEHLGYAVNYRVYTPANYPQLAGLPALYVTDGQDFLAFGKLDVVLDNLIADGRIEPVIAVFIDPRDVVTQENRRNEQFFDNPEYGQFIAGELVPEIDRRYRTDPSPDARLIIGTSNGGYFTPYFALTHADVFHFVTAFSPSFWHNPALIETYREADVLPLRFFISTGVFNDNDYYARQFADMLQDKGYPTVYLESNESHSYGNWRGKFDDMLEFFFPADAISGAH
jgi:enterochelin esterase family protein